MRQRSLLDYSIEGIKKRIIEVLERNGGYIIVEDYHDLVIAFKKLYGIEYRLEDIEKAISLLRRQKIVFTTVLGDTMKRIKCNKILAEELTEIVDIAEAIVNTVRHVHGMVVTLSSELKSMAEEFKPPYMLEETATSLIALLSRYTETAELRDRVEQLMAKYRECLKTTRGDKILIRLTNKYIKQHNIPYRKPLFYTDQPTLLQKLGIVPGQG